jgi:hypothetical protein
MDTNALNNTAHHIAFCIVALGLNCQVMAETIRQSNKRALKGTSAVDTSSRISYFQRNIGS